MENPLSVCGKFQNFSFFPSFNAYETVDEFETSCEKPVASQHSLHVRDETMKSYLLVSLPSTTFTMLGEDLFPSCHLCYHIYAHRQSFTSMWNILACF